MPPTEKPRASMKVDQKVMSQSSVPSSPGPGARKEDWIGSQLRRVFDDALSEDIPQSMLDLLTALDEDPVAGRKDNQSGPDGDADDETKGQP